MNLILENSKYVEYYTYLDRVFDAIPELQKFNWLITDLEVNFVDDPRFYQEPVLIDGSSLNQVLQKTSIQFIWAVFSGYLEKLIEIPDELPFADGNPDFWEGSLKPQAKGAQLEIVCWDSTCTLFINVSDGMATKLKELYPDIKNLDLDNKYRTRRMR
jgi:hypothetical protein